MRSFLLLTLLVQCNWEMCALVWVILNAFMFELDPEIGVASSVVVLCLDVPSSLCFSIADVLYILLVTYVFLILNFIPRSCTWAPSSPAIGSLEASNLLLQMDLQGSRIVPMQFFIFYMNVWNLCSIWIVI